MNRYNGIKTILTFNKQMGKPQMTTSEIYKTYHAFDPTVTLGSISSFITYYSQPGYGKPHTLNRTNGRVSLV